MFSRCDRRVRQFHHHSAKRLKFAKRMGDNGRALMLAKYNWPVIAQRMIDVIANKIQYVTTNRVPNEATICGVLPVGVPRDLTQRVLLNNPFESYIC